MHVLFFLAFNLLLLHFGILPFSSLLGIFHIRGRTDACVLTALLFLGSVWPSSFYAPSTQRNSLIS